MKSESMSQTRKMRKIKSRKFPKRIYLYSSPRIAQRMAYKYLGKTAKLYPASNPAKKYMILFMAHASMSMKMAESFPS